MVIWQRSSDLEQRSSALQGRNDDDLKPTSGRGDDYFYKIQTHLLRNRGFHSMRLSGLGIYQSRFTLDSRRNPA